MGTQIDILLCLQPWENCSQNIYWKGEIFIFIQWQCLGEVANQGEMVLEWDITPMDTMMATLFLCH